MVSEFCSCQTQCIRQCQWSSVTFISERLHLRGKACWKSIPQRSCSNSSDWWWLIKYEEEDGHLYSMAMVFFHLLATKSRSALIYSFVSHSNEDININGKNAFRLVISCPVISCHILFMTTFLSMEALHNAANLLSNYYPH